MGKEVFKVPITKLACDIELTKEVTVTLKASYLLLLLGVFTGQRLLDKGRKLFLIGC